MDTTPVGDYSFIIPNDWEPIEAYTDSIGQNAIKEYGNLYQFFINNEKEVYLFISGSKFVYVPNIYIRSGLNFVRVNTHNDQNDKPVLKPEDFRNNKLSYVVNREITTAPVLVEGANLTLEKINYSSSNFNSQDYSVAKPGVQTNKVDYDLSDIKVTERGIRNFVDIKTEQHLYSLVNNILSFVEEYEKTDMPEVDPGDETQ